MVSFKIWKFPKKKKNTKRAIRSPWALLISGFGILVIFLSISTYLAYKMGSNRMEKLSHEVINLRSAMNIDSVRQYQIQKIMRIIEKHNPNLSSVETYDIASEIYEMSVKYTNLNVDLLCAVITHETAGTWNPKVVSKANALGLMQVLPVTGYFIADHEGISWTTPEDVLFNPVYNLRIGSRLLSSLIGQYGLDGALVAYNGGEKLAAVWLANGRDDQFLWSETRKYVPAVRKLYEEYQTRGL
ncbi:MAG TPA: transglycosylase SLT domain-containing protein [bacterium]